MRIVNRETFLALPAGTLFQEYDPRCFGPIEVFEGPFGYNDYLSEPLSNATDFVGEAAMDKADNIVLDGGASSENIPVVYGESCGRDGCFENGQLYAVYDKEDTQRLIDFLQAQLARV